MMKIPHPPWRWVLFVSWLALLTAFAVLLCLVPLTETLGYEFCLFISLASSLGAGHIASAYPARIRDRNASFPGARFPVLIIYSRALMLGLSLLIVPLALSLLNGLRVPTCNPGEGMAFFLLMPIPSVVLATAFGTACGLAAPGAKTAAFLWFAIFVGALALALSRFHSTPAVYVFGPFHGYYPGVLYDRLISVDDRLITYRLVGGVHLALILVACSALIDTATLRLVPWRISGRGKPILVALALGAVTAGLFIAAPLIGHRTERADLLEALSIEVSTRNNLVLHFSPSTPPGTVSALARDAAFSRHQVEELLDTDDGKRIDVFIFASTSQKGRLMGASNTNVAKPWRSEVYVVVDAVPHRVLRHELAHAVSAGFGRGPFAIAGSLGGLIPDPGLIEGVAVAAQGPRTDLTTHQWSAAMKELDILPGLDRIFGLGFFKVAAPTAYTVAGSFCTWLVTEHGADALKKVYGGASWTEATGKDLEELSRQWLAFLDGVPLENADLAAARHRFDRPSVIGSVCVHEVARLNSEYRKMAGYQRHDDAMKLLYQAHGKSGGATSTSNAIFDGLTAAGEESTVRKMAAELLASKGTGKVRRAAILETLADMDAAADKSSAARSSFELLAEEASSESVRRRLLVKGHLTTIPSVENGLVLAALARIPGPDSPSAPLLMLEMARLAAERDDDPWLAYLIARQHFALGDTERSVKMIDRAISLGVSTTAPSIWLETRIMLGRALLELGRHDEAQKTFEALANSSRLRDGARAEASEWVLRCKYERASKGTSPATPETL